MHTIARIVKILFYIPIFLLIWPALVILTGAIFLVETDEGPLRTFFLQDIRRYGLRKGFSLFMRENFIKTYKYNIQGFVIGAAGFLVVTVGLRSLGILPAEIVYLALGIEFFLLLIYGVAMFYTTDSISPSDNGSSSAAAERRETLTTTLVSLNQRLDQLTAYMQRSEKRLEPAETKEFNDKFLNSAKNLADHLALLESRLKITEGKFDQLAKLNGSMDNLSQHLELIVGDHLNSRVRREFESILGQLTQRASTPSR